MGRGGLGPFPGKGRKVLWLPAIRYPHATSLKPGVMAAARVSSGLEQETRLSLQHPFPTNPGPEQSLRLGLHIGKRTERRPGRREGVPPYLPAVQLLRQDAEKVIGEVAQQRRVPVPVAPLAGRGCGVQHIDAGGREGTVRRGRSGPDTGVPARHSGILLGTARPLPAAPAASIHSCAARGLRSPSLRALCSWLLRWTGWI